MIKPAKLVESELQARLQEHAFDERLRYFFRGREHFEFDIKSSSWSKLQAASINPSGEVVGFFTTNVDRQRHVVTNLGVLRFSEERSVTFARDLYRFVGSLFVKWDFNKVKWNTSVDNPALGMYKRAVEYYSGRVVGRLKDDYALPNGRITDALLFEIHSEDVEPEHTRQERTTE